MTKDQYKAMGYAVSVNIDQAIIDRAEADVIAAYVSPILPDVNVEERQDVQRCIADLAYLLVLQRTLKVTRGGTKEKTSPSSNNAGEWSALSEQAHTAAMAIDMLRKMEGAVCGAKVSDICKINFKTNFFYS